jgi:hypothetical protein
MIFSENRHPLFRIMQLDDSKSDGKARACAWVAA